MGTRDRAKIEVALCRPSGTRNSFGRSQRLRAGLFKVSPALRAGSLAKWATSMRDRDFQAQLKLSSNEVPVQARTAASLILSM